MLFSSISFIYYFLPFVIIIYFAVPKRAKNFVLFATSLLFYFYGEPKYIFVMIVTIIVAYVSALLIDKYKDRKIKKVFFVFALMISIGSLAIFKYADFAIQNINSICRTDIKLLKVTMPIGISFYTFQLLSYVIDVYNKKVEVQKSFLKLATYVSLFPQLIAGPIVRYETVEKELDTRSHTIENFSYGATRFVVGLAKKVLIANALGQLCMQFSISNEKSVLFYWIYGISYSLQIYFDFSAYSDMAIGLGRIFGFHFLENFNYPYLSKSITEFWRRWHISLGSWFRDYVYIPLGGSRAGKLKQIRNIFVVWFLTGLWHGANWTFIVWGLGFGIVLVIEKNIKSKLKLNDNMPKVTQFGINAIKRVYVLFIVMVSFIIFDGETLSQALFNIKGLFGGNEKVFVTKETLYYLKSYAMILLVSIIGATPLIKGLIEKLKSSMKTKKFINCVQPIVVASLLICVTAYLVDNSYNPFLYFRF